jgi:hypothetical protein
VLVIIILRSRKKKEKIESSEDPKWTGLRVVQLGGFEEETSAVQMKKGPSEEMDNNRVDKTKTEEERGKKEKNLEKKEKSFENTSDKRNIDENNNKNENNINDDEKRGSVLDVEFLENQEGKKQFNLDVQKEESLLLKKNKEKKKVHKSKGLEDNRKSKKKKKEKKKSIKLSQDVGISSVMVKEFGSVFYIGIFIKFFSIIFYF